MVFINGYITVRSSSSSCNGDAVFVVDRCQWLNV